MLLFVQLDQQSVAEGQIPSARSYKWEPFRAATQRLIQLSKRADTVLRYAVDPTDSRTRHSPETCGFEQRGQRRSSLASLGHVLHHSRNAISARTCRLMLFET